MRANNRRLVRTDDSGQNKTDCNLTREQKHGLDREQKQTQGLNYDYKLQKETKAGLKRKSQKRN